jgi:hypothetical protein
LYKLEQFKLKSEKLKEVRRVTKAQRPLIMLHLIETLEEYPTEWFDSKKACSFMRANYGARRRNYDPYRIGHYFRRLFIDGLVQKQTFRGCQTPFYRLKR